MKVRVAEAADLTKRRLNRLVKADGFEFERQSEANKYDLSYRMTEEIQLCRRLAYRHLGLRLGLFQRDGILGDDVEDDTDVDTDLLQGLVQSARIPDTLIMGAIVHPLFQSKLRMVAAGLCTGEQYDNGMVELVERVARIIEMESAGSIAAITTGSSSGSSSSDIDTPSKFSRHDTGDAVNAKSSATVDAEREVAKYVYWNSSKFLPTIDSMAKKELGALDENGQPKEAVISIGKVEARGENLPSGKNHADYINGKGHYDVVRYVKDHEGEFKHLALVIKGSSALT